MKPFLQATNIALQPLRTIELLRKLQRNGRKSKQKHGPTTCKLRRSLERYCDQPWPFYAPSRYRVRSADHMAAGFVAFVPKAGVGQTAISTVSLQIGLRQPLSMSLLAGASAVMRLPLHRCALPGGG